MDYAVACDQHVHAVALAADLAVQRVSLRKGVGWREQLLYVVCASFFVAVVRS